MMNATDIDIFDELTFYLIDISAFHAAKISVSSSSFFALDLCAAILPSTLEVPRSGWNQTLMRTAEHVRVFGKHQQVLGERQFRTKSIGNKIS